METKIKTLVNPYTFKLDEGSTIGLPPDGCTDDIKLKVGDNVKIVFDKYDTTIIKYVWVNNRLFYSRA